jgi:Tol biopolymer transport system component
MKGLIAKISLLLVISTIAIACGSMKASRSVLSPVIESVVSHDFDLMIEKLPAGDDLLFLSLAGDDSVLSPFVLGIDLYSVNTQNLRSTCLTCILNSDVAVETVVLFLPPALSSQKLLLAVNGAVINKDESVYANGLWIVDLRHGGVRCIEGEKSYKNPIWSQDGKRIAFSGGSSLIGFIDVWSGELISKYDLRRDFSSDTDSFQHLPPLSHYDGNFSWSPNGKYILYDADKHIVRLNIDHLTGTVLRQSETLTDYSRPTYTLSAWSPSGHQISFVSNVAERPSGITMKDLYGVFGNKLIFTMDLFVVDADGNNEICLTCDHSNAPAWMYTPKLSPTWSPNGKQIAFFGTDLSHLPEIYENLYIADIEKDELRILAQFPQIGRGSPRWSSDGQQLAFSAKYEGDYSIFVIDADGNNLRVIAHEPGIDFVFPLWLDN